MSHIDAMNPSVMIAGLSYFPVCKEDEWSSLRNRHFELYAEIEGIPEYIKGIGMQGIRSDDVHALEKLRIKLKETEEAQMCMRDFCSYFHEQKNRSIVKLIKWFL